MSIRKRFLRDGSTSIYFVDKKGNDIDIAVFGDEIRFWKDGVYKGNLFYTHETLELSELQQSVNELITITTQLTHDVSEKADIEYVDTRLQELYTSVSILIPKRLDTWSSYSPSKSTWVLSALLGQDLNFRLGELEQGSSTVYQPLLSGTGFVKSVHGVISYDTNEYASVLHTHAWESITNKPTTFNPSTHTHSFTTLTNNPTTLSGYGIVDAAPLSHVGSGGSAHTISTVNTAGFMSAADKVKLNSISPNANLYVHPDHYGDVTSVGDGELTIGLLKVTNAMLAGSIAVSKLAANTISGILLGGTLAALTMASPLSATSTYDGSSAVTIGLSAGYGDLQNPYTTKAKNLVLASPSSSSGLPTFRALTTEDLPTVQLVDTAVKLQNARTIFGQSFDGTANVSGNLNVGDSDGLYIKIGGAKLVWDATNKLLKLVDAVGTDAINFYATGSVAAYGIGGHGGGGTSYDRLDAWTDYLPERSTWVLSAGLGEDLRSRVATLESSTPNISWGVPTSQYTPLIINGLTKNLSLDGHVHSQYLTAITKAQVEAVLTGAITSHTHAYLPTSHANDSSHLTAGQQQVLNALSIVDGRLQISVDAYSTGALAAYGIGGPGGGIIDYNRLDSWEDYTEETATWLLSALLGNDLHSRVSTLEGATPNIWFGTSTTNYVPLSINDITKNLSLDGHTHSQYLTAITSSMVTTALGFTPLSTSHAGDASHLSESQKSILSSFSIVDGKLKVSLDLYSTGSISAYGVGGVGGGTGIIENVLDSSYLGGSFSDATLTETFNAYTINRLHTRLQTIESGAATTIAESGAGNAYTGYSKTGNIITFLKNKTFSEVGHSHSQYLTAITSGMITTALGYTPLSVSHAGDVSHLTEAQRNILGLFSIVNGNLQIAANTYSTGFISALGLGEGGGGGTSYNRLDLWSDYGVDKESWVLSALLGYDLHTRLSSVESITPNIAWGTPNSSYSPLTINGVTRNLSVDIHTHDDRYILSSLKGAVNGVAELDTNGRVPSSQLPSYVDDVIEVANYAALPATGESGKIYVTLDNNLTYRWAGTVYSEISASLALGETSSTAYRGDRGKTAYDHSQITGGVHISTTERTHWDTAYTNNHTHSNKALLDGFSQANANILSHLFLDANGKLYTDIDFYSQASVSAYGVGGVGGGSGLIQTVFDSTYLGTTFSDTSLVDTFNAYAINSIYNRVLTLEGGAAINLFESGTGNAYTGYTKNGSALTFLKGKTFSEAGHTHVKASITDFAHTHVKADITDFPTTWDWANITSKPSAFTPSAHTHLWADLTDKPTTFAPSAHTHTKSQITDFPTTWSWNDITLKPLAYIPTAHTHLWADITDKPSTFTPSSHNHDDRYYTETEISNFFAGVTAITGYNKSNWDAAYTNSHTHTNKSLLDAFSQGNANVLSHLFLDVNGNLYTDINFYSQQSLSAQGIGGGGGGTSYDRLDTWGEYTSDKATWVLSALLGKDLDTRVTTLQNATPNITWGTPTSQYTPLTINGVQRLLSVDGHVHSQYSLATHNHTGVYDPYGAAAAVTPTTLGLVIGTNVLAYRTFGTAANSNTGDFDAVGTASSAISTHNSTYNHANIANGQMAYGWGNHAGLYSLLGHDHTFASLTSKPTTIAGFGITDAITTGNISSQSVSRSLYSTIQDTRNYEPQLLPDDYVEYEATYEFTDNITPGWHSAITMKGWTDGYAVWQLIGCSNTYTTDTWFLRSGINGSWNPLRTIIHSGNISSQSVSYAATAGSAPASDVYAWAKASTKPSYNYSEIGGTVPTWNQNTTGNADTATKLYDQGHWANGDGFYRIPWWDRIAMNSGNKYMYHTDTLTFQPQTGILNSPYFRGQFQKSGSSDSYVLLGGGGHKAVSSLFQMNSTYVANLNTGWRGNILDYWDPDTIGTPYFYGTLLTFSHDAVNWNNQIGFGTNNELYFRQAINKIDFTGEVWKKIYHSANSNLSTVDWAAKNLNVNGTLNVLNDAPVICINGYTTNGFRGINYQQNGSSFAHQRANASSGEFRNEIGAAVGWGGYYTFYTDTVERLRISNYGLGVSGNIYSEATNAGTSWMPYYQLFLKGNSTSEPATIQFGNSGQSNYGSYWKFTVNAGYAANTPIDALVLAPDGATFASTVQTSGLSVYSGNASSVINFRNEASAGVRHIGYSVSDARFYFDNGSVELFTLNNTGAATFLSTISATNAILSTSDGTYIQIGNIRLQYDQTNNALKAVHSNGSAANLYATGTISGQGIGSGSSGGGLISSVLGSASLGGTFSDTDFTSTFNAYTINYLHTLIGQKVNWYPTALAWTGGSTSGPIGTLSGYGMSSVILPAIPSASATASGVVTTGGQVFSGAKQFASTVQMLSGFDCTNIAYFRGDIKVLNKAANGWLDFVMRDTSGAETLMNLSNIGSINGAPIITTDSNIETSGYFKAKKLEPGIQAALVNKFTTMGQKLNYQPGMIRSGRIPKKVVVIGNSMTYHGYLENVWEVSDYREMAASKPNSGWVSLVQQHLINLNPDVKVYKSNGAAWETTTNGSRAYSTIQGVKAIEVLTTNCVDSGYTLDQILDSDVDVIIVQMYENCPDTTGDASACATLAQDYANLYASLRTKCPNASMYQFCGFWQTEGKGSAIISACAKNNVEPIHAPVLMMARTGVSAYPDNFKAVQNTDIYDGNNEQITSVSSFAAGHPNDFGFACMAAYTIFKLYNSGMVLNDFLTRFVLKCNATVTAEQWLDATTDVIGDIYIDGTVTDITTFGNLYNPYLKYLLLGGRYPATFKAPTNSGGTAFSAVHGWIENSHTGTSSNNYFPMTQKYTSGVSTTNYDMLRKIVLSSNAMVWGSWSVK